MISSMTGHGRAEILQGEISCVVEIRSVNNRFMDISLRLPKKFSQLGDLARKTIKKNFSRGSFDISITINGSEKETAQYLKPNIELARQYLSSAETLKKELNIEGTLTLDSILSLKEILLFEKADEDSEAYEGILEKTLAEAIQGLKKMRAVEGEAIFTDVSGRLKIISEKAEKIKSEQPRIIEDYSNRLLKKIELLVKESDVDPGRVAQEAAIFAERADVSEEITRIASHINQFRKHLENDGAIGRKMDFMLQELNRETNTLLSKVPDYSCSDDAIEIKCELEKIREQIQNVE